MRVKWQNRKLLNLKSNSSDKLPSSIELFRSCMIVIFPFEHVIVDKITKLTHSFLYNIGGHFGWILHCWRTINFYKPHFVFLIYHKIETKYLECISTTLDILFNTFQSFNCDFFNLWMNFLFKNVFAFIHLLQ